MRSALERLRERIIGRFPSAQVSIDSPSPKNPEGNWSLNVTLGNKRLTMEWRQKQGLGISDSSKSSDHGFGEGPDEVSKKIDSALEGIIKLLNESTLF